MRFGHEMSRLDVDVQMTPQPPDIYGGPIRGYQYSYQVCWDSVVTASGVAESPAALGRALGAAFASMAEGYEKRAPAKPRFGRG